MSNLKMPPPPPPKKKAITLDPLDKPVGTTVQGLREFRKNMTKMFEEAYNDKVVEIVEMGFDRKEKARYKLVKVSDTKPV